MRKFARRNKTAFTVAAAMLLLLLAGIVATTWQAVRATQAREESDEARKKSDEALHEAEKARDEAEDVASFMTTVLKSPDPSVDGRKITVAETLDAAAKDLETRFAGRPERRARLQATLGRTYEALGLSGRAIPLQEKARDYHLATSGAEHPITLAATGILSSSGSRNPRPPAARGLMRHEETKRAGYGASVSNSRL